MDQLIARVQQTIQNLSDKKEFLDVERNRYIDIRDRLLQYNPSDYTDKGHVLGDVIIAAKIFVGIGCEYFVEKSCEDAIEYVESKLKVIETAVVQFNEKIEEAKKTLNTMEQVKKSESGEEKVNEDGLPFMEIREELDEDGNVVESSVTPQKPLHDNDELRELFEDMEIVPRQAETLPKVEKIEPKAQADAKSKDEDTQSKVQAQNETKETPFQSLYKEFGIVDKSLVWETEDEPIELIKPIDLCADESVLMNKEPADEVSEVADLIVEQEPAVSDFIIEKESAVADLIVEKEPAVSDFIIEKEPAVADLVIEKEPAVSEFVVEKEPVISDVRETEPAVSDFIVENDSFGTSQQLSNSPSNQNSHKTAVSRFKKDRITDISIPVSENITENQESPVSSMTSSSGQPKEVDFKDVHVSGFKPDQPAIDPKDFLSLNDLMDQLDLGAEEIESEFLDAEFDEDEFDDLEELEDEDLYDEDYMPSLVPASAMSSFMQQINELRASRGPKPILKKDDKHGPKKTVNFAPELDIHEVESYKSEIKANTFNFPRFPMVDDIYSNNVEEELDFLLKPKHELTVRNEATDERQQLPKPKVSKFKLRQQSGDDIPLRHRPAERPIVPTFEDTVFEDSVFEDTIVERELENDLELPLRQPMKEAFGSFKKDPPKSHVFQKNLKSLAKPKTVPNKPKEVDFSSDEEEVAEFEPEATETLPLRTKHKREDSPTTNGQSFSSSSQKTSSSSTSEPIQINTKDLKAPTIDYAGISGSMEDMARAYMLGMYDDDIKEDPGHVVEKLDDFKQYNEEVVERKDEIEEFLMENPLSNDMPDMEDESEMMVDIIENETEFVSDEYNLENEVAIGYRQMREKFARERRAPENLELEPIDESGNPIRVSRFKSALRH